MRRIEAMVINFDHTPAVAAIDIDVGNKGVVSHAIFSHSSSARLVAAVFIGRELALPPKPRR
jgi:hypothetical protein